jgi:uncharacterized membrane protein YeaQ/YmgE (transglycosylase-associated protein family)
MGLDAKVNKQDRILTSTHENSTAMGTTLKIFAGLAGVVLVGFLYTTFVRSKQEKSKKFV